MEKLGLIPGRSRYFSPRHSAQASYGAHPAFWVVKWLMCEASHSLYSNVTVIWVELHLHSPHIFTARHWINHWEDVIFCFTLVISTLREQTAFSECWSATQRHSLTYTVVMFWKVQCQVIFSTGQIAYGYGRKYAYIHGSPVEIKIATHNPIGRSMTTPTAVLSPS
jgi:hypothetical protein